MLRVVTTNNSQVFRHLGSRAIQSGGVDHTVTTDYESTLAAVRERSPQIAIIDVELPGGDGYQLSRAIKSDPTTRDVCVMLVIDSIVSREQIEKLRDSCCDDVLALPIHPDEFHQHLIRSAGLPFRRHARVDVEVDVEVTRGIEQARLMQQVAGERPDGSPAAPVTGVCVNLSATGAGVELSGPVRARELLSVTLHHQGRSFAPILATVAWVRPADQPAGAVLAGINFAEVPLEARLLIEEMCLFDVHPRADGGVEVSLRGHFSESVDFSPLAERLEREHEIEFNTREVRYMSSIGVRKWSELMTSMAGKKIRFRQMSMAFATQVAMVPMAGGDAEILSFEAPYYCEHCDREELRLLEAAALLREPDQITPPPLACSSCHQELAFDDVPNRYFSFLLR